MFNCSICHSEKILCVCPKGLDGGGAEESKDAQKDKVYDDIVTQICKALLNQYTDIFQNNPRNIPEFINNLRIVLNNESAENLLELLKQGVVTDADRIAFTEIFKSLNPNMAMLDALSHRFALNVFPSPANQFIAGIKQELKDLPPFPDVDGRNFEKILVIYAEYYASLNVEQQKTLSRIFWAQIKELGTPIIESNPEKPTECNVYFLFPKDKLDDSKDEKASPGTKKDLYLQGDFHGIGSTEGRQRLSELSNTGIMCTKIACPKNPL